MTTKWLASFRIGFASVVREIDGHHLRVEGRGADMWLVKIDGMLIDTVEGLEAGKRRAMKALRTGEHLK